MTRHEQLIKALQQNFGFDSFKGNQEAIINNLMDGKDTFVLMPTGGGKSLCYQLPSLLMEGVAIVISPLIALMKNQVDAMRNFSEEDGVAHFLNSSLSRPEIHAVKADVLSGKTKLLYVAPESLTKDENVDFLREVKISFYAVDEAHCISEWGHDFRPEYRRIHPIVERIGKAPIIALTATATPKVQHDIQKNLDMLHATVFKSSFNRPNLYYEVREKNDEVDKDIVKYIRTMSGKSGIIYCLSRKTVEELAATLNVNNIPALPYHAGMDAATRSANQDAFLMEKVQVIVATIAFGMGIDKPDVRMVIHHDLPDTIEAYFQEAGRAGRDEQRAFAVLLYDPAKDKAKARKRITDNYPPKEFIADVYHKTCDFLGVGAGSGQGHTFMLQINDLCRIMHLPILQTYAALHLLTQAGYINFQEEQEIQPRVKILISRREINDYGLNSEQYQLLEILMRKYTGIFTAFQYVHIGDEAMRLSGERREAKNERQIDIHNLLVSLAQRHIITYIPHDTANTLTFTRERQTDIYLSNQIYENHRQQYINKLKAMVEYADNTLYCRSQLLLSYFGENDADICGSCDVCRSKARG